MGEAGSVENQGADLGAKLQKLLTSHEVLLKSQDALLGGYQALNDAIRAIIEANAKSNFLTEDLKRELLAAVDASQKGLSAYLENVQRSREP